MDELLTHPITNYHTHTWRCMHARGTEEQYIQYALDTGFEVLGFADHTPWPYKSDFVANMRMRLDQFEEYRRTILGLRAKYAGRLEIPLGLECEPFPEYLDWLRDFKAQYLDYILLGCHYDYTDEGDHYKLYPEGAFYFGRCTRPEHIRHYAERILYGMQTGLYDYVAHPDLFLHTYPVFDADSRAISHDICQAAVQYNLPLEYNLLGVSRHAEERTKGWRCYPCEDFWAIAAQYPIRAIVGFDAHDPDFIGRRDLFVTARRQLAGFGIPVIERLPGV